MGAGLVTTVAAQNAVGDSFREVSGCMIGTEFGRHSIGDCVEKGVSAVRELISSVADVNVKECVDAATPGTQK